MQAYKYIFYLVVICGLIACEEVIDLPIDNSDPVFVIEGYVYDLPDLSEIRISRTSDVYEELEVDFVSNAQVTVNNDQGNSWDLLHTENGIYKADGLFGIPGTTYTLNVDVDGQSFSSSSTMPNRISIDSVHIEPPAFTFEDSVYLLYLNWTDIGGEENYYLFDYIRNGKQNDIFIYVQDDLVIDGVHTRAPFFGEVFEPGDTITSYLKTLNEDVYNYFFVLSNIAASGGPGGSVTPQNPDTNIEGGAIGFFSASTIDSVYTIIQP